MEYVESLTTIASVSLRPYDIFALALLGLMLMFGAWKGMAWQIAQFASYAGSWYVAVNFSSTFAPMIGADPPWDRLIAMLVLFLGTSFLIWIAFSWISSLIKKVRLKDFDRQAGAMLGLMNGVLLLMVVTFFGVMLSQSAQEKIFDSTSGYYTTMLIQKTMPFLPDDIEGALSKITGDFDFNETVDENRPIEPPNPIVPEDEVAQDDEPEGSSDVEPEVNPGVPSSGSAGSSGSSGSDSGFDLDAIRSWLEESGSGSETESETEVDPGSNSGGSSDEEDDSTGSALRDFLDEQAPIRINPWDLLDIRYEVPSDKLDPLPLVVEPERAGERESFQGTLVWRSKRQNSTQT